MCSRKGENSRELMPGSLCSQKVIGKAISFEWELARLGEVESSHDLKKICGNRNIGGSPMTCQPEMASVSSSCSVLKFLYMSQVAICQHILRAPPCGLAEGNTFLLWETDLTLAQVQRPTQVSRMGNRGALYSVQLPPTNPVEKRQRELFVSWKSLSQKGK